MSFRKALGRKHRLPEICWMHLSVFFIPVVPNAVLSTARNLWASRIFARSGKVGSGASFFDVPVRERWAAKVECQKR